MMDVKAFANDDIEKLLQFCNQGNSVICYGAGRYAFTVVSLLKKQNIVVSDCLITNQVNSESYFMGDIPIHSIRDYIVSFGKKYYIVLALQPVFQTDVIQEIQKKFVGSAEILQLTDDNIEQISNYDRNVERNQCLLRPINIVGNVLRQYEKRLHDLLIKYEKIEVRYIDMLQIGNYVSWTYFYINEKQLDNRRTFLLFYPVVSSLRPDWQMKGANTYLLNKFKTEEMEVLSVANINFWRYARQKQPGRFVFDNFFSRIEWIRQFNSFSLSTEWLEEREYISFSSKEEAAGTKMMDQMGINGGFVCFAVRDLLYLRQVANYQTDVAIRSAKYRNSDVSRCQYAMENLAQFSLQAVRMGAMVGESLTWKNTIDYAHDYRDEFMDVYLSSKCRFFVCNPSGIQALPQLFSKPLVSVNTTILSTRNDFLLLGSRTRDLVIFKKYWWEREKRYLTFLEMLDRETDEQYHDIASAGTFAAYDAEGIIPVENTPEEINDVVQEMVARLNGTMVYTEQDDRLQQQYFDLIDTYPMKHNFPFMWRVGAKFLRENPWLLE